MDETNNFSSADLEVNEMCVLALTRLPSVTVTIVHLPIIKSLFKSLLKDP